MNKKVGIISISVILVILIGFGIISSKSNNTTKVDSGDLIKIVDGNGEVEVKKNPQKVISFDYGVIDALDSIGIEVIGLPKGNGSIPESLSKYKDEKYKDLGDLKEPNFELINELKPDLIIISGRQLELIEKFEEIAPTIYLNIDGGNYMADLTRNMSALGKIFDKEKELNEELNKLTSEIESIKNEVEKQQLNALTVMVNEGSISAFSDKSRFGFLYNELGFKNVDPKIEDSKHGQQVTFEYVLEQNPQYLFVIDRGDAQGQANTAKALFDNELVKSTEVYKNNKIIYLNSEAWYIIAGGLKSTQAMIEDIKNVIK